MPAGVAFEALLDEHLRVPSPPASRNHVQPGVASAAAYGFFFVSPSAPTLPPHGILRQAGRSVRASAPEVLRPYQPVTDVTGRRAGSGQTEHRGRPEAVRPARVISARERSAIATFSQLGAELSDDFSAADLRRAFRRLALAYHPDRHGHASDAERAQLAASFGRARDAYRVLLDASTRVH